MAINKPITYSSFDFSDETKNVGTTTREKVQRAIELMHEQIQNGPVFSTVVYYGGTGTVVGQNVQNIYAHYLYMVYWGDLYLVLCNNGTWFSKYYNGN